MNPVSIDAHPSARAPSSPEQPLLEEYKSAAADHLIEHADACLKDGRHPE